MEIEVSERQGRVPVMVFHIKGELLTEDELEARAQEAFEAGSRNLLLDLTGVTHISSQGLRALHNIYMLFRQDTAEESDEVVKAGIAAGTFTAPHLKLLNPSQDVSKVLSMTGYDMFLQIHRNLDEAVASF